MVEISLDESLSPVDMGSFKIRIPCKYTRAVHHAVRFHIGLVDNIKSVTVTERIPEVIIRIVTRTYSIDVQPLHDKDILYHISLGHHISLIRIHFMSVRALDKDRFSVDKKLSTLDAYIPETDFNRSLFCLALLVENLDVESIQPWSFSSPLLYRRHLQFSTHYRKSSFGTLLGCHSNSP